MNLVMIGPAAQSSSIAQSNNLLINTLHELGHSVSIIRSESKEYLGGEAYAFAKGAKHWNTDATKELLKNADLIFYVLGNNIQYHEGVLHLRNDYPGLMILHDICLTKLFLEFTQQQSSKENAVKELKDYVSYWYGAAAAKKCSAVNDLSDVEKMATQYFPMTEWGAMNALGVITHFSEGLQRIAKVCSGPIVALSDVKDSTMILDSQFYADNVINIAHSVLRLAPFLSTARQSGAHLAKWGMTPDSSAIKYVVEPMRILAGK